MHFNAKWITYATGPYRSIEDRYGNPAPYFRKTFSLSGKVKKATLSASALGVYKLYVNGAPAAEDYLSPGWVDYNKKLPFVVYDITERLETHNAVGAVVGDGWAVGHVGSNTTFKRTSYSDEIQFCAEIRIEYESGEICRIPTDESWLASKGEILRSDIYMGEYMDHRLSLGDFSAYDYNDSAWEHAKADPFRFPRNIYLEEMPIPPIVVKHTFTPTLMWKKGGQYLYDVSQNIAGVVRIRLRGTRGSQIVVRHGELVVDGKLYTENLRKAEATDTYILSGEPEETFRPLLTFHGFRYFEVTVTGEAELLELTAESMYTDLPKTGTFSTSDPVVNRIYQNALWSQRDNFLNVPTDCPQRDERLGWTADAQIFCQSAMYNMDCDKFYQKYCADMREAQLGNGIIPAVAPLPHIGFYSYVGFGPAAGWCEAIAEIPYCHYRTYGDRKIIRDNLFAIKKMLDYYESTCPDHIRRVNGYVYGDWLSLGSPTDKDVVSTLYYARAAYIASVLCSIIGDYEAARYAALFERIKQRFNEVFVDTVGKILSDTQSCYAIAWRFGVIDRELAYRNLKRKFEVDDEGKLTCGFLGVRFLLPALCDLGLTDIAYDLITNRKYPGWGYSVMNGATTIWEHWDSYTEANGIREGMNSFNHYAFGSCTEWMYEYCLGITPNMEKPGFKAVTFRPHFPSKDQLTAAEGYYDSVCGRIHVRWEQAGREFLYTVSCPEDMEVHFDFGAMALTEEKADGCKRTFRLKPV